jgi:dTMP kinase
MTAPGKLITLEGGEGTGKSTLAAALAAALRTQGREVIVTREPGGSAGADDIRKLLVTGGAERWSPMSEALLFAAARCDHVECTMRPALERGAWVICDRYVDSTYAYQVAAGGLAPETFHALNQLIAPPAPDLTLVLDLDPQAGLARSRGEALGEGRYERKDAAFHDRVREAFVDIALREPQRCVVLNAAQPPDSLLADSLLVIKARLE